MSKNTISQKDLVVVLQKTALELKQHVDELRDLDAALGDGDLGVTIELGANAMLSFLSVPVDSDIGRMLGKLGMDINKVNPSTFGTLLASAFMGAGKAVQSKVEISYEDLTLMGNGAIEAIKKRGKAEVGDKTMLDALAPAVEALKASIETKDDIALTLQKVAAAAKKGTDATAAMKAKFGRVSWRPDGGMGLKDGGATAMYFLISAFIQNLQELVRTENK